MDDNDVLTPMITSDRVEAYPTLIAPKEACTVGKDNGLGGKYNGRITEAWKKGNSVKRLGRRRRGWMRHKNRI